MQQDKRISLIFKKELSENVIKIQDCSNGIEQIVKFIETNKDKYIIKFPLKGNRKMIFREAFACEQIKDTKFIPKIILRGNYYLIESFLNGKTLSKTKLEAAEANKVYTDLGKLVRKIHKIEMEGFGELQTNSIMGKHQTLDQHIDFLLRRDIPLLRKTELLTKEELSNLRRYIKDYIKFINQNESVLLHFDLIDSNILVKDGKFSGLIDFGDLSCGPRAYDLAKLYIEKNDTDYFTAFLKGYGKIDMKEIEYFAVCHLLYEIPYFYSVNKKNKYQRLLRLLKRLAQI